MPSFFASVVSMIVAKCTCVYISVGGQFREWGEGERKERGRRKKKKEGRNEAGSVDSNVLEWTPTSLSFTV